MNQTKHDLETWHKILNHCNIQDFLKLPKAVNGIEIIGNKSREFCEICTLGKMAKYRSRQPDARAKSRLEIVHCDLAGPVDLISIDGFSYALSFTDDFLGQIMTYLLKQKSNTVEATEKYLADCAPYGKIKRLRSDNGTELTSNEFEGLMTSNGIHHEKSALYSPHQSETAERTWRTLFNMVRCLLLEAKLPKYLWTYAVLAASCIHNRCYNCRLGKTPFEVYTGTKPNIKNMNIFGTTFEHYYAYIQDKKKLDPRARKDLCGL